MYGGVRGGESPLLDMFRFELRHYMYLPPPYLNHALCHPSTGVPVCLSVSPGFPASASLRRDKPPRSGSTAGLPYIAPTGTLISAGCCPFAIYGKWGEISLCSVKPCVRSVKLCTRWVSSETSRHAPLNVGFVGANTIGVLDFSPTYYQGIPP